MDGSECDLRDAYRAATVRPPGPCPEAEALAALAGADGEPVDEAIRSQVVDHVARCANCADELKTLFALRDVIDAAVFAPAGVQDHSDDPAPLRWLTAWAKWRSNPARSIPVMLVVLAAVLGVTYVVWRATHTASFVDERERSASAWVIATVPSDRATLASAPSRLEWTSAMAAESYRVTLYDAESTPVWESPPVTTSYVDIPVDVRARLTPGLPVFWRVVALSGIDRRESGLHRFTIVTSPTPST